MRGGGGHATTDPSHETDKVEARVTYYTAAVLRIAPGLELVISTAEAVQCWHFQLTPDHSHFWLGFQKVVNIAALPFIYKYYKNSLNKIF